jgi:DNA mismatch repair protein MutS2
VVGNDLSLNASVPGLVLTGPNAGGKTVVLKSLGLAALLAKAGIPVPCAPG